MDDVRSLRRLIDRLRIDERITDLVNKVAGLGTSLAKVNAKDQRFGTTLTALAVGTTDVAITWPDPWPDTSYIVIPTVITGAAAVGLVTATLTAGSKTVLGATVTVANRTAGMLASVGLDVLGVRT